MPDATDLDQIGTPTAFAQELTRRRELAGKSVRTVAKETGLPASTLGGYFSGRHLPPLQHLDGFRALLAALAAPDQEYDDWLAALRRVRRLPGQRASDTNPYRGLAGYGLDDAALFFGREELADRILVTVDQLVSPSWLTLVGASGSGKSSLLRAGVLARLRAQGREVHVVAPREVTDELVATLSPGTVVGIDQFEELFAPDVSEEERAAVVARLMHLAGGAAPRCTVLAAVRADFFGRCLDEPGLLALFGDRQVVVGPPSADELARAITEPARVRNREVEPELVELILAEAGGRSIAEAGEMSVLPLVSHALSVIWDRSRGPLRVADYVASGRIDGAIRRTAEDVWSSLTGDEQDQSRRLLSHLVSVDATGIVLRHRLDRADAVALAANDVVERWINARILTADSATVAISHEVLLRAWPRLQEWIADDMGRLRLVHRISQRAVAWSEAGCAEPELLRGAVLELVAEMQVAGADDQPLAPTLKAYVEASLAVRDREVARERRSRRRVRMLLVGVSVLALGASLLSVALWHAVHDAREARANALSRQVALAANSVADQDPVLAAKLALTAYEVAPTVEARSALLMTSVRPASGRILGVPGSMKAAYSPDGRWVVTATVDGKVHFHRLDPDDPAASPGDGPVVDLPGAATELWAQAFTPDGRLLAIGGADGAITVIDLTDPTKPRLAEQHPPAAEAGIQALAFDSTGSELAAASGEQLLRWRRAGPTWTALPSVTGFDGAVKAVAYSSRGQVATGSQDGAARLWNPAPGGRLVLEHTFSIGPADRFVFAVAFDPSGHTLAAGGNDHLVHLWDTTTKKEIRPPLSGFSSWVNAIAFSHDGSRVAAVGSSNSGWIWSTRDWVPLQQVVGPTNFTAVDFAPDDSAIVTGEITGVTRIVRMGVAPTFGDSVFSIAYQADGTHLFASVGPKAPAIVQMDTSDPLLPRLQGSGYAHTQIDGAGAVSPDGEIVVAGSMVGQRPVFHTDDTGTGRPAVVLTDNETITESVAFSSDGQWVATVSDDQWLQVYPLGEDDLPDEPLVVELDALPLSVAFLPGAPVLAVATTDKRVHLYRVAGELTEISSVGGFENWAYAVTFSPDGKTLFASSADKTVRVYDVADPEHPRQVGDAYGGPRDVPSQLAVSADGRFLAAASSDDSVWLWSVEDQQLTRYAQLRNLGERPNAVAFDPRGGVLAAAGAAGRMALWSVDPTAIAREICRTSGALITREEWEEYLPDVGYDPPC